MLSYRHSFHAGNFADVLKHIVLVEILQHLQRKVGAIDHIDTHAGAGLFDLRSEHAQKLAEYRNGIARLDPADWPELATYLSIVASFNPGGTLHAYPGSPMIARRLMRPQDRASLFELHPTDCALLEQHMQGDRRIRVMREDGLPGLLRLLPPRSRRALVLIDPSYELKAEYEQVVATLKQAYKKFATGTYALWYPVVDRNRVNDLIQQIQNSGIRNIQRFELAIAADSAARGMTASGMVVINPPWTLLQTLAKLLPRLVQVLGRDDGAFFRADVLVNE
ncbi:MAG: 23S rRNA (adenine(2030)-N(6))-methyltransferase RlmJ [Xanthomonadales bacterium]|nr:23S rRNA (adenine(2030)-N(6))-methyltransferase RlmJ [Xanthomonadales bacterium]